MQARVLATATEAPTLAIAVNASAYQLAAAFAAWLGGQVINGGFGLRSIYLVGAALTVAGIAVSCYAWLRDGRSSSFRADVADGGNGGGEGVQVFGRPHRG